jgi:putative PIN family toxin of toxin-antitoxin system
LIVIDASWIVGAALKPGNAPWRALVRVRKHDRVAMSGVVTAEIRDVLARPKFALALTQSDQANIAALLFADARWFALMIRITDCRDANDNKYLELALGANASVLISSDKDLLSLHPWRGVPILLPSNYPMLF